MMHEQGPNTNDYEPDVYQDASYTGDNQTDPLMGELNDTPAELFQFVDDEAETAYSDELGKYVTDEDHENDQTGERDAA